MEVHRRQIRRSWRSCALDARPFILFHFIHDHPRRFSFVFAHKRNSFFVFYGIHWLFRAETKEKASNELLSRICSFPLQKRLYATSFGAGKSGALTLRYEEHFQCSQQLNHFVLRCKLLRQRESWRFDGFAGPLHRSANKANTRDRDTRHETQKNAKLPGFERRVGIGQAAGSM